MSANHEGTLFVTGASGHLGRRVVELLLAKGGAGIVAGTRKPEKLADLAARVWLCAKPTSKMRRDWKRRSRE